MGRFITEDPARDGLNWFVYVSNNPLSRIDPTGLLEIVEDGLLYNHHTDSYKLESGNIKDKTSIDIQRTKDHTDGHYKSTLNVNIELRNGEKISLYENDVQSWADLADPNDPTEYTVPAGEYEGRLYGNTASYKKPIGLVNEDLGVKEDHHVLIHPNEMSRGRKLKWSNTGSAEACQVMQGQLPKYSVFTGVLESLGFRFGSGYKEYSDTIKVNVIDPKNIYTTREGEEINVKNITP